MNRIAALFTTLVLMLGCLTPAAVVATQPAVEATTTPVASLQFQVEGTPTADGGWKFSKITFFNKSNEAILLVTNSNNLGFTIFSDIVDGIYQGSETVQMENFQFIGITGQVDNVPLPCGTIYKNEGILYWYPPEKMPWFVPTAPAGNNG